MTVSRRAWGAAAIIAAVVFYGLALRSDVYEATSPHSVTRALFGDGALRIEHPFWLSVHFWLRKVYSVIAFTIVGFAAQRALAPVRRPIVRAALLVGGYSLSIEIGQRVFDGYEPELESAFDVACGAVGGWLAVLADDRTKRATLGKPRHSARARLR